MMLALSLWQPWASLVAWGDKRAETRSWAPPSRLLGEDVAICATASDPPRIRDLVCTRPFRQVLAGRLGVRPEPGALAQLYDRLPHASVLAVARVLGVHRVSTSRDASAVGPNVMDWFRFLAPEWEPAEHEHDFGDYSPGRHAWILGDVRPLTTPVPAKGRQRLWPLPADVEAQVRAQVPA